MSYIAISAIFFLLLFDRLNIFFYILISSALHEAGHIFACLIMGGKPQVELSVFGLKLKRYSKEKNKKLFIAVCGPAVNLILSVCGFFLLKENFTLNMYIFVCVNIILFIFNMMPISFLDGGQIVSYFADGPRLRNIMDFTSFLFIFLMIFVFSENKFFSIIMLFVFIVYYIINKYKDI